VNLPDAFRAVADLVPDPLLLVDRAGTICAANRAMDELVGEGVSERRLVHLCKASPQAVEELLASCRRASGRVPTRLRIATADGSDLSLRCVAHTHGTDATHIVIRVVTPNERDAFAALTERVQSLNSEIQRRREVEERMATVHRELEAINQAKDAFLATVSHELRTPLNAIYGWAVTLRRVSPPEAIDRGLAVIERNARSQARLIEDVLDLSRIISGKLRLERAPVSSADVVAAAVDTVRAAADAKQITLEVAVDAWVVLLADADRLQQIVWNLVSNAVKFTPNGGAVSVTGVLDGARWVLTVRDNGQGIASEHLNAIFEPFRQADASTTRRHGGLGLGLAIVRQLVHGHGGTIHVESAGEGKGATFVAVFPVNSPRAIHPSPLPIAPTENGSVVSRDASPRLDGLKVLVVDDDPDARDLLLETFLGRGAKVMTAESAATGYDAFRVFGPDVIVSDIGMPNVDGYTFLRRIRALAPAEGGRTPAIALTAYAGADDTRRAFSAGFQNHVPKPVDPGRLTALVANLGGIVDSG
jgi:signal transduction histidine kinase/ActR/RegA family two-component response regulator